MFWHIKQVFIRLLIFSSSLATKYVSLSNEACMVRHTLIELNPIELNYYQFMFSLDKCNGSCNAVDDLSAKICIPIKTKDINVKAFNTIAIIYEAKTLVKHIPCDCKSQFNSATCNTNQKWNNETCQCRCKMCRKCKKDYRRNPSTCICENGKYLRSIADTSVIVCDEVINASDIAPTKMTNNISANVTNTLPTNVMSNVPTKFSNKKVRYTMDCYNLHIVLLVIMLLFMFAITCHHYSKHEFLKVRTKIARIIILMTWLNLKILILMIF